MSAPKNTDAQTNVSELPLVKPGYVFTMHAELGSGRTLSIVGNLPVNADRKVIDAELDKLVGAVDRKLTEAVIPAHEEELITMLDRLELAKAAGAHIEAKYKGKNQPVQEEREKEQLANSIAAETAKVAQKKAYIAKLKAQVGQKADGA